jgi:hypothetical protein
VPADAAVELSYPCEGSHRRSAAGREVHHPLSSSPEVKEGGGELSIRSWRDAQATKAHGEVYISLLDDHVRDELQHLLSYQGVNVRQASSNESYGFVP